MVFLEAENRRREMVGETEGNIDSKDMAGPLAGEGGVVLIVSKPGVGVLGSPSLIGSGK